MLFQDNFSPEQFKKIVEELVSETSCSVCSDTVKQPVYLCASGHGVCGKCGFGLNKCPKCAEPLSSNTSNNVGPLLKKLLDLLPPKCGYDGCKELNPPGGEHEKWCGYHPTTCQMENCEWTGIGKDICHHISKDHRGTQQFNNNNSRCNLFVVFSSYNTCIPLFAHGHFFWVVISNSDKNVVAVKFTYVPNGKMKRPLKMTLGFEKSEKSLSASIYVTPENALDEEETSMSFVSSRVKSLLDNKWVRDLSRIQVKKGLTLSLTVEQD